LKAGRKEHNHREKRFKTLAKKEEIDYMDEYENLLDEAYKNLPEKAIGGEPLEIPKFDVFTEGNKTLIRNFQSVTDKLRRTDDLLIKFLSKELAVPITKEGDRVVIHRKINAEMINKKLEEFTLRYVICKECKKPDTNITDAGHGFKQLVCEVCGAKNSIR